MGAAAARSIPALVIAVALLVAAIAPPGQVRALQSDSAKGSYCLMGMDSGTKSMINGCLSTYRQCHTLSNDCCEAINKVGGTGCLGRPGSGGMFKGDNYGVADDLNLNFKNICGGKIDYNV